MRACLRFAVVACVVLACLMQTPPAKGDASDLQAAQQKFDAGQYPDALRLISAGLGKIKSNDDTGQRYQWLMLRGECLLRINQRSAATNAFQLAAKCAPDVKSTAIARANALLVQASPRGKYIPKAGGEPIDILDPNSRKQAFDALREDMTKAVQPKYDAAMDGTTLPPMMNVLPSVLDLGYLEYSATGSAEQTRKDLAAMGQRARELMNDEIKRIGYQINALEAASNSTQDYVRRGLFSGEQQSVQDSIEYLRKIEQTARDARRRARELGFDGAPWEPVIADADDLADRSQALLNVGN